MKKLNVITLALAFQSVVCLTALTEDQEGKPKRAEIYDRNADGNQQIAAALKTAKAENKHVILKFGANWCGWCHKLSKIFKENDEIAGVLNENYLLVLIDVDQMDGKAHNQDVGQRYGDPTRFGLPALVVLDSNGKQLTIQDSGKLEEGDHHDPKKVMAFLEKWKPEAKR